MNLASVRAAVGDLAGVGEVLDGLADEVETYFVAKLPHLCFQLADAAKESNDIGLARYWIGRGLRSARENGLDRTADARKLVDLLTEIDAMPAT
jgi:hypothetical protein